MRANKIKAQSNNGLFSSTEKCADAAVLFVGKGNRKLLLSQRNGNQLSMFKSFCVSFPAQNLGFV
jgi:hypothetical protein